MLFLLLGGEGQDEGGQILCRLPIPLHLLNPTGDLGQLDQQISHASAGRNRHYPRPEDAFDHVESEMIESFRAADTHDGGGDDVRGGHGHSEMGGGDQHSGAGGFGGETVNGMEADHFVSKGFDDAPAAHGGAGAHRQGAEDFYPRSDFQFRNVP